jgi:hypothetical protein
VSPRSQGWILRIPNSLFRIYNIRVMPTIRSQRCFVHPDREAVARCPGCGRFFCRECVTEHEDRVLCAACIARSAAVPVQGQGPWRWLVQSVEMCFGVLLGWLFFYYLGRVFAWLPEILPKGNFWTGG